MRDIKFRVFEEGKMEFIGAMDWDCKYKIMTCNTETRKIYRLDPGPLKIMQYTGLKDKSGVEVYEGDIMKYTGTACPCCHRLADVMPNYHCEIRWDSGYANFEAYSHNYDDTLCADEWANNMVVIGNIYENPELLNK
jgi:uncharacterized phage protein (TIGR01671 family)